MSELKVKSVEVRSQHPDADGYYVWMEYDADDISRLNIWPNAIYRFRYECGSISEERNFN